VTWNAPSPASPQAPGTQVTLSAAATGCPNPVYQFWVQTPSGSWSVIQAYSSASTASWNTTGLPAGTYSLDVWVRQSGSAADFEAEIKPYLTYTLQVPNTCTAVTWNTPVPTSPQAPGVQVTLSGSASGCPSPTYEFWVQAPGGQWTILQGFSSTSTYTWNTTGLATGTYLFDIAAERLIAAWGISKGRHVGARDASRMAGHPLSAGPHYHRGHAIPHTLGGPTDINLVPQLGRINVGPFRPFEKKAVATPGSLYFTYWIYGSAAARIGTPTQTPTGVDQGLLIAGQMPQIARHGN